MMTLVYPMFATVVLTVLVAVYMLYVRVHAIRAKQVDPRYLKLRDGRPTEQMLKAERHFANLFEVPVLFYVGCLLAIHFGIQSEWLMFWAWLFVVARAAHAYIHLGRNKIYPRLVAFSLSFIATVAIWVIVVSKSS